MDGRRQVSNQLQDLISKARELMATGRKLRADHNAWMARYIAKNNRLCALSNDAISRSRILLAKHREKQ